MALTIFTDANIRGGEASSHLFSICLLWHRQELLDNRPPCPPANNYPGDLRISIRLSGWSQRCILAQTPWILQISHSDNYYTSTLNQTFYPLIHPPSAQSKRMNQQRGQELEIQSVHVKVTHPSTHSHIWRFTYSYSQELLIDLGLGVILFTRTKGHLTRK